MQNPDFFSSSHDISVGPVANVTWSQNGKFALVANNQGTMHLWDIESSQRIQVFPGHQGSLFDIMLSTNDKYILSSGRDQTIRLWDAVSGRALRQISTEESPVVSFAWTPNMSYIVAGGRREVVVRDFETWESIAQHDLFKGQVTCVNWGIQSEAFIFGSSNGDVCLQSVVTGNRVRAARGHNGHVLDLAMSYTTSLIASSGADGFIRIHDSTTGEEVSALDGRGIAVTCLCWLRSDSELMLLSGASDSTVRLWDIRQRKEVFQVTGQGTPVLNVFTDSVNLFSAAIDDSLRVWHL